MNWRKIKRDYPKAFVQYCKFNIRLSDLDKPFGFEAWDAKDYIKHFFDWLKFKPANNFRNSYDFFDHNDIFISINLKVQYAREVDHEGNNPHYVPEGFCYSIHDKSYKLGGGGGSKRRTKVEEEAFIDAFKILEERL